VKEKRSPPEQNTKTFQHWMSPVLYRYQYQYEEATTHHHLLPPAPPWQSHSFSHHSSSIGKTSTSSFILPVEANCNLHHFIRNPSMNTDQAKSFASHVKPKTRTKIVMAIITGLMAYAVYCNLSLSTL
jgi:hypothetical protein